MMYPQQDLFDSFRRGPRHGSRTFIICHEDTLQQPYVLAEGYCYPIINFCACIRNPYESILKIPNVKIFPRNYRIGLNSTGMRPDRSYFALADAMQNKMLAVSGDRSPIKGFLFLSAAGRDLKEPVFVLSAVFDIVEDQQVSSLLWDSSSELINHWNMQAQLMGKPDFFFDLEELQKRLQERIPIGGLITDNLSKSDERIEIS